MASTAVMAEDLDNLSGDFRLRLETVEQDNAAQDATALTLRSRLTYASDSYSGFSGKLELENNTALVDDYNDTLGNGGEFSVVADPEFTELDQAYAQYQKAAFSATLGRQVLTFDNHRFVGHVGWRQDRQTFDALTASYGFTEALQAKLVYIIQRNRIFSDERDLDSKDVLLNVAYKLGGGTFSAYTYLLELDNGTDNSLDTFGLRYAGKTKAGEVGISYAAEAALQSSQTGAAENDASYLLLEAGAALKGIKVTLGYESLGSDDGAYGFSTPLATLHKFNGWSDQFLGTPAEGLVDTYISVGGKLAGGKWLLAYHDFSADDASPAVDDLGSEINALYARKFAYGFSGGIKYAAYRAGDTKVDTDKLWAWVGYSF
ncbi:MAG: alginate export family protein [Panacagrimonas sp.]